MPSSLLGSGCRDTHTPELDKHFGDHLKKKQLTRKICKSTMRKKRKKKEHIKGMVQKSACFLCEDSAVFYRKSICLLLFLLIIIVVFNFQFKLHILINISLCKVDDNKVSNFYQIIYPSYMEKDLVSFLFMRCGAGDLPGGRRFFFFFFIRVKYESI